MVKFLIMSEVDIGYKNPTYLADRETSSHEASIRWGRALWMMLRPLTMAVSEETKDNLARLDEHLAEGGSTVFYTYHSSKLDGGAYPPFVRAHLPSMQRALGPIGRAQYEGWQKSFMDFYGKKLHVHVMPVMRPDRSEDFMFGDDQEMVRRAYFYQLNQIVGGESGLLGIAPVGGRYRFSDVDVADIKPSYLRYGKKFENVIYTPAAIFRDGGRLKIEVGRPFFLSDLGVENTNDMVLPTMRRMAELLPPELRGNFA